MFEQEMIEVSKDSLYRALLEAGYDESSIFIKHSGRYGEVRVYEKIDEDNWPLVWRVCEREGVAWGAGNGMSDCDQHQIDLLKRWEGSRENSYLR